MNLILLPIFVIKYWYFEAPISLLIYFSHINKVFLHHFSLLLMLRTFFRPLKNEYRKGLIWFSILMGMVVKTILIATDLFLLIFLLFFEIVIFGIFLTGPFIAFYISFVKLI